MSAMEMLEATRERLNQASVRVAKLEAEKSDLVEIIWQQLQREAIAHRSSSQLSSQQSPGAVNE
jgi:BMFP domain-containing protein YqiC